MKLYEKEITIKAYTGRGSLVEYIKDQINQRLEPNDVPIRFIISETDQSSYHCEIGLLNAVEEQPIVSPSIFDFRRRLVENNDQFNVILIIPTGIGASIGGDAGDGNPVARLIASVCDNLITHPNVVNASDINELPPNGLYVEGSVLTSLIMGTVGLQKVVSNKILLAIDNHDDSYFTDSAINSASAARATLGLECNVIKMNQKFAMETSYSSSGRATGQIKGLNFLFQLLNKHRSTFDAIAISSVIQVPENLQLNYFSQDITNPWGGVEAMLTHAVSSVFHVPSAHSPMMFNREILNTPLGIVDPRKAAEAISLTFLHCILKGLHRSPKIITNPEAMAWPGIISAEDISCIVIPEGCLGLPTIAAMEQGIPVVTVKENVNSMKNDLNNLPFQTGKLYQADNYLEAVGFIAALRSGVAPSSVRRPLSPTIIL